MTQKVVLRRDQKKPSSSYLKYFLWAAVGLVILVVITPLVSRDGSEKGKVQRAAPDEGVVFKEIPKSTAAPEQTSPLTGKPGHAVPEKEQRFAGENVGRDAGDSGEKGETALSAPQKTSERVAGVALGEAEQPVASPEEPSAEPQQTASVEKKVEPAESIPPAKIEAASTPGTLKYVVQVGSFTRKENAEKLVKSLKTKGYDVVIKTIMHSKLGRLYVVRLTPVDSANEAQRLMDKVGEDANVKPMIVRISDTE